MTAACPRIWCPTGTTLVWGIGRVGCQHHLTNPIIARVGDVETAGFIHHNV